MIKKMAVWQTQLRRGNFSEIKILRVPRSIWTRIKLFRFSSNHRACQSQWQMKSKELFGLFLKAMTVALTTFKNCLSLLASASPPLSSSQAMKGWRNFPLWRSQKSAAPPPTYYRRQTIPNQKRHHSTRENSWATISLAPTDRAMIFSCRINHLFTKLQGPSCTTCSHRWLSPNQMSKIGHSWTHPRYCQPLMSTSLLNMTRVGKSRTLRGGS